MHWPGNSPDFKPNENFWAKLKEKVADEHPTSGKDLEMAIKVYGRKRLQINTANIWYIACLLSASCYQEQRWIFQILESYIKTG